MGCKTAPNTDSCTNARATPTTMDVSTWSWYRYDIPAINNNGREAVNRSRGVTSTKSSWWSGEEGEERKLSIVTVLLERAYIED
mmetsp:Transcript_23998/g.39151  ORF Transcript_23998/g.39151 Transcript_23998/m.39151 type:complete len:84 (-) Transcript_23998:165-416(-)